MLKNWSPDNKPKGISCSKSSAHCVTLASAGGLFQNMLIQSVNYFYFGSLGDIVVKFTKCHLGIH